MRPTTPSPVALRLCLGFGLVAAVVHADLVEDFDGGWSDPSYSGVSTYNHPGVGIWESQDALVSSDKARSGDGVRFGQGSNSPYLEFQGLDGNGIDGGVGSVAFWYRHWDGDGNEISFNLEYSIDGGDWVSAGGATVTTSEVYQRFSAILDLEADNVLLRVVTTTNNERLLLDDFEVSTVGDSVARLGFQAASSSISESGGVIRIPVQMAPAGEGSLSVSLAGGTASEGADFELLTSNLVFTAGDALQEVEVSVRDDLSPEAAETIIIELGDPLGGELGIARHTLSIIDDDESSGHESDGQITIMSANTTSGNQQAYEGPGERIFQALDPDIVGIQEFNVSDAGGIRAWVDRVFGEEFHFMVEAGNEAIPNGVVSRYPIIASGEWQDPQVGNRDFAWATIDIPGAIDLHVVSVHFHSSGGSSSRNIQAGVVVDEVSSQFPEDDYIVLCGDLNTSTRNEAAVQTLSEVFSDQRVPVDQSGGDDTNQNRNKPYDRVMPNAALEALHSNLIVEGVTFTQGMVFDSRAWSTPPAPVQSGDSAVSGMQHMAVMKSYAIPLTAALGTPIAWLEEYGITENYDQAELLDPDGDGLLTWEEYVSDTNPMDAGSYPKIVSVEPGEGIRVTCETRGQRRYQIEFADGVIGPGGELDWQPFSNPVAGLYDEFRPGSSTFTFVDDFGPNTSGGPAEGPSRLYRVSVSLP